MRGRGKAKDEGSQTCFCMFYWQCQWQFHSNIHPSPDSLTSYYFILEQRMTDSRIVPEVDLKAYFYILAVSSTFLLFSPTMIIAEQFEILLQKAYHKVQYVYPIVNQTFVFLAHRLSGTDVLVLSDSYGKTLFQHSFDCIVDTLQVPSREEAVALLPRQDVIMHINLSNHYVTKIPFQFMMESTENSHIYCFSRTRYLCVAENGSHGDHRLKLSYFSPPLLANSKPFAVYESKDQEWTTDCLIDKLNDRSMISWFKARHDDGIELRLYEISENLKGAMRVIRSQQSLAAFHGLKVCNTALLNIWETKPNNFLIMTLTSRSQSKSSENINSNYILDHQGNIRQLKFEIPHPYNCLLVDKLNLGHYCMVRTFAFDKSRPASTPVYYIDNNTEELIAEESWECSHLFKFSVPGYDNSYLIEAQYENEDVHLIKLACKRPAEQKMLGLHLLLELHENFDDNLLQDILECLPDPYQL